MYGVKRIFRRDSKIEVRGKSEETKYKIGLHLYIKWLKLKQTQKKDNPENKGGVLVV